MKYDSKSRFGTFLAISGLLIIHLFLQVSHQQESTGDADIWTATQYSIQGFLQGKLMYLNQLVVILWQRIMYEIIGNIEVIHGSKRFRMLCRAIMNRLKTS